MLTTDQGILIGMSGLLIGLSIGLGFSTHRKKNQPQPSKMSFQSHRQSREASRELQEKLIAMVGGDRQSAERLVARARFCRYGKSEAY